MKYPEGQEITVGDLVWFDEGSCIGFIESIQGSTSVTLNNVHPFAECLSMDKYVLPEPGFGGRIVLKESEFYDDGLGLLSEIERNDFYKAYTKAKSHTNSDFSLTIARTIHEKDIWYWVFIFCDIDFKELSVEHIRFPTR